MVLYACTLSTSDLYADHPIMIKFPHATHIELCNNNPDRSLLGEDASLLFQRLSPVDQKLINNIWRFKPSHMINHTTDIRVGTFTSDEIVSFSLYIGIGSDTSNSFGLICAIPIYREDKELFKPCFSRAKCKYTAIGNPELKSSRVVDENKFLSTIRENPTSKTVCNLLLCLTLKNSGQGQYVC